MAQFFGETPVAGISGFGELKDTTDIFERIPQSLEKPGRADDGHRLRGVELASPGGFGER